MATHSASTIATCACRHTCGIAQRLIQRTASANIHEVQVVGQGNDQDESRAKLLRYQEENIRLRSVIHDVTEVNKRWQKYNQERVGYVQKLLSTIGELQKKEANAPKQEETIVRAQQERMHVENTILRKELDECEKSYRHLNAKMDLCRHDFAEQLQVLEMQMKMHKDDWEAEKREKEEATRTADKLKEEIEAIEIKLSDVQKQLNKPKYTAVYICVCKNHTREIDGRFDCKIADSLKCQNAHNTVHVLPCQNIIRPPSTPAHSPNNGSLIRKCRPSDEGQRSKFSGRLSSASSSSSMSSSSSSLSPPLYSFMVDSTTTNNFDRHGPNRVVKLDLDGRVKVAAHHGQGIGSSSGGNAKLAASSNRSSTSSSSTWKLICPKCRRVFPSNLQLQFTSHIDECQENMHTCSQ